MLDLVGIQTMSCTRIEVLLFWRSKELAHYEKDGRMELEKWYLGIVKTPSKHLRPSKHHS
jgi:hypothetical protein